MADDKHQWITLIKELRTQHGVGILEAERIALSRPEWRRWVERQINSDSSCRKLATRHMRSNGAASLLEDNGGLLRIR